MFHDRNNKAYNIITDIVAKLVLIKNLAIRCQNTLEKSNKGKSIKF